jgi:hypothetical protein
LRSAIGRALQRLRELGGQKAPLFSGGPIGKLALDDGRRASRV